MVMGLSVRFAEYHGESMLPSDREPILVAYLFTHKLKAASTAKEVMLQHNLRHRY